MSSRVLRRRKKVVARALVIGFAAETENLIENAKAKTGAQGMRLDCR
jgi:phosphopantothenoylcysteine synthetase/decarboxylase